MPQQNKQDPVTQIPDDDEPRQGMTIHLGDHEQVSAALEMTRDYRGDTTLHLKDGESVAGFVFDVGGSGPDDRSLRLDLPGEGGRRTILASEISHIEFDGRDPAAGKSWEGWVKRYAEKKLAGEAASIESEKLD